MPRKSAASSRTRTTKTRVVYKRAPATRTYSVKRYAVRGRGGYWDNVKSRWDQGGGNFKNTFRAAGSALYGKPGAEVGGLLNRALYALTGFGDYQVKSNSLLETGGPPSVVNRSNKEFVVRHREYITDIYSSSGTASTPSGFFNQIFPLNPGSSVTFPWLSSIAGKFEQYRIEGMVFEYKSLYSDAVVTQNGSIGAVILATEYNAGAAAYTSKQQMENYQFAQSCKPSHSVLHPIECARSQNVLSELYVRPSTVPAGEDIKTYDFGDFQIASQGIPLGAGGTPVPMGELWVSYQIALIKPKIPQSGPASYIDSGYSHYLSSTLAAGNFTTAQPFGPLGSMLPAHASNIPGIVFSPNTISIPLTSVPMRYQINMMWSNDSDVIGWACPGSLSISNGSLVTSTYVNGPVLIPFPAGTFTSRGAQGLFLLELPAQTGSINTCVLTMAANGGFPAQSIRCNVFINAVPFGSI